LSDLTHYTVVIEALSDEDGGGFLATVPDLPGCMSDGETRAEAAHNVEDAIACWIEEAIETGRQVPAPSKTLTFAS
jgi:antitoxin HicB